MQRTELIGLLARFLKIDVARITENTQLTNLVVDSFVLIELLVELQDELGIILVQEDLDGITTVRQLLDVCEKKIADDEVSMHPA